MSMLLGLALSLAAAAGSPDAAPRPEDVATIDGMIRAYYEVVSGGAGVPRDWARTGPSTSRTCASSTWTRTPTASPSRRS